MGETILITGGAGFIGSNFINYLLGRYYDYKVVNLDLLTYAGKLENLQEIENDPRYKFIKGDICNRQLVEHIFKEFNIKGVINFAAESHVDNSIIDPDVFIKSNIMGTHNLIDVARNYWMTSPNNFKEEYVNCRFLQVSTDEVYGSLDKTGFFTEKTPYAPNSPYSASKASADMIVRSYHKTYGMNIVITCCSNNYGPKQHEEKLIPTIIRKAIAGENIPIYGNGKNIRDWLYVLDHCKAIDLVFHEGKVGDTYNIGGNNEKENIYIANQVCEILDEIASDFKINKTFNSYKELITFVNDRPGHDWRYAIDSTKIRTELGWKPEENFESGIRKTVEWYLQNA